MTSTTDLVHGDDVGRRDSITPSIAQGLNWDHEGPEEFAAVSKEPMSPYLYNRHGNINHEQVARLIAKMEGAERAFMTACGMGAFTTTMLTFLSAGDHVVGQRSMYGGVNSALTNLLPRLGIECEQVDQQDTDAFERAIRPTTKLVLLETPSNPRLEVTDLQAVTEIAKANGALTVADNTFATPLNQRPLEHGVDIVWHSATKYFGGHADLMAGVIAGREEHMDEVWRTTQVVGSVLAPFNAWLVLRGLRTLSLRVSRHNENALAVAQALEGHPAVKVVNYPGLTSHPRHEIAAKQMSGFGGVLSVEFSGGHEAAERFVSSLHLFARASSLGDVHSLVVHPAALWAKAMSPQELEAAGVGPGLVRLACGIEDSEHLIEDVIAAADAV